MTLQEALNLITVNCLNVSQSIYHVCVLAQVNV